jgi:hypothetical protein
MIQSFAMSRLRRGIIPSFFDPDGCAAGIEKGDGVDSNVGQRAGTGMFGCGSS